MSNKVKIITDSTVDVNLEEIKKLGVHVQPLIVNLGGVDYFDGENISNDMIYKHVKETGQLPKTAAVSSEVFRDLFAKYIEEGYDIFYVGIGGKLSGTFQAAVIASSELPEGRVFFADSNNLSSATGLLLYKAIKLRDNGLSAKDICSIINKLSNDVSAQFAVDTLDYLHKGGRCSGTVRLFGHLLHIHPVIKVIDGKLVVYRKPRGKYIKAIDEMLEIIQGDIPNVDLDHVFITHTGAKQEYLDYFYNELIKIVPQSCVEITNAGSVITSHCGYGTIGVLYIKK